MADGIGNNIQCISESANSFGGYHRGSGNANNCTISVCGNVTSQPVANNISISDLLL
jgi:hypothetical protein